MQFQRDFEALSEKYEKPLENKKYALVKAEEELGWTKLNHNDFIFNLKDIEYIMESSQTMQEKLPENLLEFVPFHDFEENLKVDFKNIVKEFIRKYWFKMIA